jgi:hypothetical protein
LAKQRNPSVKGFTQEEGQIFVMDTTKLRKFYYKKWLNMRT